MAAINQQIKSVEALELMLHGQRVGIIAHYTGGKNILSFDPEYVALPEHARATFTLTQKMDTAYLQRSRIHSHRLAPVLSNLLPEGMLRTWMATTLKIHPENEFPLLAWTGSNLPGALVAHPLPPGQIPAWALSSRDQVEAIQVDVQNVAQKFSLAGVQIKFSSLRQDGRFNIGADIGADSWIIKSPSTLHRNLPENEFSAMRLAEAMGVVIPEIELVALDTLDNFPEIQLPNETLAYAIRRFDRGDQGRIHTEDFAQVFELYAHDKYGKRNYEQIATALYRFGASGLADVQQMARRLLANIMLANGDAHLKNWTLLYSDTFSPRLSPAYDIVSTLPFVPGETNLALNLAKQKNWYTINLDSFAAWSKRIDVPWPAVRVHLLDAVDRARDAWPKLLTELPMRDGHKDILRAHWARLADDWRLG